ncbi:hypothetical protein [Actinomycetospora sp. TBRC 11914]|uniref:hypothetical protein n=1 Tax=Actinomycetospora sp. TBRC 11914 TaxID=2729387 RepID=UPI00145CD9FC|nr:hypothetical protein [Actinomycetospora sp. TBRC 11914]NMO92602.1 hypothetical protein [Actinomycetospora sp. TBRC 11914]
MTAKPRPAPRYRFQRDTRYLVTVVDDDGARLDHRLDAYQGWLAGPDGIRHRFGAHRRARTEIRDDRIAATVGPVAAG